MATETKTITKTRFNREYNNYGKRGHRTVDCWENKRKEKDNEGKTSLWDPYYVETFKNTTRKNITHNG